MKKQILVPVLIIIIVAGMLLGMSFGLNKIAVANAQAEHQKIMETILPGSKVFTVEPYAGDDANIRSIHKGETGFVVETVTYGYAGDITMLIGVTSEGKVTGLVVRDMSDTLGLGGNALTDHEFLAQFLNTSGEAEVGTNIDTISGATVTSKAITRSINSAVAYVTGADTDSGATAWGG
jgi:Na+-translocating ferredoxin:NAD+ oxidoreductase RnfG subunit